MPRVQAASGAAPPDLAGIFDTVEFRDAYRISYLANAIVVPIIAAKATRQEVPRVIWHHHDQ